MPSLIAGFAQQHQPTVQTAQHIADALVERCRTPVRRRYVTTNAGEPKVRRNLETPVALGLCLLCACVVCENGKEGNDRERCRPVSSMKQEAHGVILLFASFVERSEILSDTCRCRSSAAVERQGDIEGNSWGHTGATLL